MASTTLTAATAKLSLFSPSGPHSQTQYRDTALPLFQTPSVRHELFGAPSLPAVQGGKRVGSNAVVARSGSAQKTPAAGAQADKGSAAISAPATVFVAGATGSTGQKIVKALLDRGLRVKAGVRNVESGRQKLGPPPSKEEALEVVSADITGDISALAAAIRGSDAVVSAIGARPSFDFKQPWIVDYQGTVNLVDACKQAGVKKLVVVSALLTNGAAKGQWLNPAFLILNANGLQLKAKHRAEQYIWNSGLDYTILRPGGLDRGATGGNLVAGAEDTIFGGSVERQQVAEAAAEALLCKEASYKVVELISKDKAPAKTFEELFAGVPSVKH